MVVDLLQRMLLFHQIVAELTDLLLHIMWDEKLKSDLRNTI